jgi:hypothetical protein
MRGGFRGAVADEFDGEKACLEKDVTRTAHHHHRIGSSQHSALSLATEC